ncbi:DUF3592 domain-containing protein [Vibrio breoganii]
MKVFKGAVITLCGLGLLVFGIKSATYNAAMKLFGSQTIGEVIAFDQLQRGNKRQYAPKARFEVAGKKYIATAVNYSSMGLYRTHQPMVVTYLPFAPSYAKLAHDVKVGDVSYLSIGIGFLLMILGFGQRTSRVQGVGWSMHKHHLG